MENHNIYLDSKKNIYRYVAIGKRVRHIEFDRFFRRYTNGKHGDDAEFYTIELDTQPLYKQSCITKEMKKMQLVN